MTRAHTSRGRFVVLDGVDGCGKSTQAQLLVARWRNESRAEVLHLREPGSTKLGERVRELVLGRELQLSVRTEALLFCAARAQLLDELVEPALTRGAHVVCERFSPSTFAYQAVAGGLGEARVLNLLREFVGQPKPDLTVILEVDPAIAARRRLGPTDRIEDKGLAFQREVARGMRRYAELEPNTLLLDGSAEPQVVERAIWTEVVRVLA